MPGYVQYGDLDPFENLVGPFWLNQNTKKGAWRVRDHNCNSMGITHGGAVMSFVDFAVFVIAGEYTFPNTNHYYVTLSLSCDFVGKSKAGTLLEADGSVVKVSKDRDIIVVTGRVYFADKGKTATTIAIFRAIIKKAGSVGQSNSSKESAGQTSKL